MKLKLLLITTLLPVASAVAASSFEGIYLGGHLGLTQAGKVRSSEWIDIGIERQLDSNPNYKVTRSWALSGGIVGGYRKAVHEKIILGASLGLDFERARVKTTGVTNTTINGTDAGSDVRRRFVLNVLGQAGYTVTKNFMPFITGGLSLTQFNHTTLGVRPVVMPLFSRTTYSPIMAGLAMGGGMAYAINDKVSTELQYLRAFYKRRKETKGAGDFIREAQYSPTVFQTVSLGVKVKI